MLSWWAPSKLVRSDVGMRQEPEVLALGPRRFGAPVLVGSNGRVWEMHAVQYTRAWRVSYRYMTEGQALVLANDCVWPLSVREVDEHLRAHSGSIVAAPARRADGLERALRGASLFGAPS
jgi:hypothetical protein